MHLLIFIIFQKEQILKLQNNIREFEAHKELVRQQIGTELQTQLTPQEREQIDTLEVCLLFNSVK